MNMMFLDLEMNQPSNKIIQVGWTIADPLSGRSYVLKGQYVFLFETLNPIISNLCGVTQDVLNNAPTITQVGEELISDFKSYNCASNLVVWGDGDVRLLKSSLLTSNIELPFANSFVNVKNLYQSWKLSKGADHLRGGLSRALTKFQLQFIGRKHNARDDAYNTFRLYHRLLKEFK